MSIINITFTQDTFYYSLPFHQTVQHQLGADHLNYINTNGNKSKNKDTI